VAANNQTTILKQLVDLAGAPFNTTLKNTSAAVTVFAPVDAVSGRILYCFSHSLAHLVATMCQTIGLFPCAVSSISPRHMFLQAFLALLKQFGASLATNKTAVAGLLAGHVVPFAITSKQLTNGMHLPTLAGYNLTVSINGSAISIVAPGSRALVLAADIMGGSSVAHVIDTVLLPAAAAGRRLRA
jgi:uncharacterized surface protein with fasciclin (FAS1) repeats